MKRWLSGLLITAAMIAVAAPAFAQGGGASSTGTIQGRVTDSQGAVLPGVTVTATSPSMLGAQTTVTSETGNYRFPAVPPGNYNITYELAGFSGVKREGILITLGFTANVNVELALATLQETVTVTGESPVIDTSATRVQQNFKLDQLESIPNGRDMWSLLAVTPGISMTRIDVGGNRAGTQTGYTAYGFSGQVRVLIEGINTTEGTGAAGFYFDYASLEEAFFGTQGQSAEMPNPGVQSQFIAKSGSNQFSGEYYLDWYNNSLQGSNIPDDVIARGIRPHSNEMTNYYDTAINVGGPIKKDKVWWHFTYREQENQVQQPSFQFDKTFNTKLWNPVAKATYQMNQNHKLIGYFQWGQKLQPNRLLGCCGSYTYADPGSTSAQDSGSWVYKAEWNGTISDNLYVEARYGDFGYYFPLLANSDTDYFFRDTQLQTVTGTERRWQIDRDRKQWTGAATYFLDTGMGSHTLKFGGEMLLEKAWEGFEQKSGGHIEHIYANNVSSSVVFDFPTASGTVGSLGAHNDLLSLSALDASGAFVNDTWAVGRATVSLGFRYDRYHGWLPEQQQLGGTIGPETIQAQSFPETHFYTWNSAAPRVGLVYDLSGDGRTVIKANYGLYWHNPGVGAASSANPNQAEKTATWSWNDINGDRRFQLGEQVARTGQALAGAVSIDPDIKQPFTHDVGIFFERQLAEMIGARVGFVYKTEDDLFGQFVPGRSALNNAYSVPFPFTDIGVDGRAGTADDRVITLHGLPTAQQSQFSLNQVVMNIPGRESRYKTIEASVTKRYANRWSVQVGTGYTWTRDFVETVANSFPQTPDRPGITDRTGWGLKATGTYEAAYGIKISPVLRHQAGVNFARQISVPGTAGTAFGLVYPASTIYADDPKENREDNIWVFDVRAEKTFNLIGRIRIRGFVDFFNITNSHASETITRTAGFDTARGLPTFERPANILAPFTTRLGFRFLW
jgi:hypothetical protein